MKKAKLKRHLWHRVIFFILRVIVGPIVKLVMGYRCKKVRGPLAPSIIIGNHNSDLDPAFVGMAFSRHIYFVASEHALRDGIKSKLLPFVFAPIPISKSHADIQSIKEMLRRLRAGASVCLFAEGDRSYNGTTGKIPASTVKLIRTSGADLITFRIEGGYFTTPRWATSRRKGRMRGKVVGRYAASEIKPMTDEQVLAIIERDTFEDAYERQKEKPVRFKGKNLAETIEAALYICPACKKIGSISSKGDRFFCKCGLEGAYLDTGFLEGESLPFLTITEWDRWQTAQLAELVEKAGGDAICEDEGQTLYRTKAAEGNELVGEGRLSISRESLDCAEQTFPIRDIARLVCVGRMTLQFSLTDGTAFEVRSAAPRSALKYKEIFKIISGHGEK